MGACGIVAESESKEWTFSTRFLPACHFYEAHQFHARTPANTVAFIHSRSSGCFTPISGLRISANVTADFGNVTDSAGLGVARC